MTTKRQAKEKAQEAIYDALVQSGTPFYGQSDPEVEREIEVQINRVLKFLGFEPVQAEAIGRQPLNLR